MARVLPLLVLQFGVNRSVRALIRASVVLPSGNAAGRVNREPVEMGLESDLVRRVSSLPCWRWSA
jgi:hypothetical protein